jgi:diguanylate cyclase (GGDEF)-like protein/PAS domain S-box-containing protein|nr:EAL domain-containing protein [Rhodoferax sp.]
MVLYRHSVLALRILVWVVVVSLAVFTLATAFGVAYERDKALRHAHLDAREAVQQSLSAISASLWQYDVVGLNAVLGGMVASQVVVRVEVLGPDKLLVDVRQPGFSGTVDHVWSVPILAQDQATALGTLRISESYAEANNQSNNTLKTLVITDLVKIIGLALVLFAIVYHKVAKHLHQLAMDVTRRGHSGDTAELTVHRKKRARYRDEIDILVDAINHFVTERKQASEAQRIAATAFNSQQGMLITDARRVILRVNSAFSQITGYSAEDAIGKTPRLLQSGRHDRAFYDTMAATLESEGSWIGEIWSRRKNGEEYPEWLSISAVKDDAGHTTHFVAIFNDITERVNALVQIDTLAFYDPLTHLPNRRLLLDRLEQALHASTRHARKSALLFVDLDNFKTINDTLGHHQGDLLLVQVAQRLKACIRDGDTLARLGSDEFVVMLEDLSEDDIEAATQSETVGDNILQAFRQDFTLEQGSHYSTPSIGITLFGGVTLESSEQPLKRAELAMFKAKAAGRNALRFFDTGMQAEVSARAALEADLREAIAGHQFLLHYQPQVVGAGRVTGVEALVRWQHPQRGMVSPAEFIPLAEEIGLILPIGQWVLETACSQLAAWASDTAMAHLTIAVNVSARQFKQADFVDTVRSTLARTHATPRLLKLELTESMLVDDIEAVIAKMGELKAHGVSFSLDDFGTGYSSLAYLKRLPLDQLKIDQGFVRNIVNDPNDAAIAKMVVALAESMGLSVIAEGVELQAQADFLAHQGCHAYQGYLFSKPLTLEALEGKLKAAGP